jgi:hypothetical protein
VAQVVHEVGPALAARGRASEREEPDDPAHALSSPRGARGARARRGATPGARCRSAGRGG